MKAPKVVLSQSNNSSWENKGLRGFLEYRDLGVVEATNNQLSAHIGRAIIAKKSTDHAPMHIHDTEFHFTYILRGWMKTYYEGIGTVIMREGDCVTCSGQVAQSHTEHSDDFEVLQITLPGQFKTTDL
jgi:hypothetical protein